MPEIALLPQVLIVSAMLLLMLLLLAAAMLPDTDENTWLTRLYQGLMFRHTRLASIMRQRGVNLSSYLSKLSASEIRQQRLACSNCRNFYFCEQQRKRAHFRYADLIFCPNRSRLTLILNQ